MDAETPVQILHKGVSISLCANALRKNMRDFFLVWFLCLMAYQPLGVI